MALLPQMAMKMGVTLSVGRVDIIWSRKAMWSDEMPSISTDFVKFCYDIYKSSIFISNFYILFLKFDTFHYNFEKIFGI